jgi:TolB protein
MAKGKRQKLKRVVFLFKKRGHLSFCLLTFAICLLLCRVSLATDVYLGLQAYGAGGKQLGVGLAPFSAASANPEAGAVAQRLRSVIREDLLFEHLFSLTEGGPAPSVKHLDAVAWSGLGAQVVVAGIVRLQGQTVALECQIYDVGTGKLLYAKEGTAVPQAEQRLAHLLADQLTFQLSGQPGIAHTRIAFINNHTHHKEIYVMDYDGHNVQQMTFDHAIALLPKWSPDGKQIAFNSYRAGNPDAYLLDYPGGSIHRLSMRQGLNTAPSWSPDGATLAITISHGGDPDLYAIDRSGRILRRLTNVLGVDTSPCFSPNGQQIAFVSDRTGNPELYVMDSAGASQQRLTYGQWVDGPAWSPRGDWIAYERQRAGSQYDIWLIDPTGRNSQPLVEGEGRNESPAWSPDGRFVAFSSTRNGRFQIFEVGADGSSPHAVGDIGGESTTPSWGP